MTNGLPRSRGGNARRLSTSRLAKRGSLPRRRCCPRPVPAQCAPGRGGIARPARPEAPEDELWLWVLAREAYKNLQREEARTGTGTPEPAAATGSPEPAQTTGTGGPEQAVTGAPEPTVTGAPVPTVTGAPVRSITPSGNTSITPSPTFQPENRTEGGQEAFMISRLAARATKRQK